MLTSPRLGLAYPQGTDTAVVPRDVQTLALYMDNNMPIFSSGVIGSRPAPTLAGRFYYATDNGILYFSTGSIWVPLNETLGEVPVGAVLDYTGGTAVPSNFMLAVGTAVNRVTYAELFGKLGTKYGPGDGTTTFNLPDYRGRVGVGQARGATGAGRVTAATDFGVSGGLDRVTLAATESGTPAHSHTAAAGDGQETSGGVPNGVGAPRVVLAAGSSAIISGGNVPGSGFGSIVTLQGNDLNNLRLQPHNHAITVNAVAAAAAAASHENTMPWLACDKIIRVL